MNSADDWLDLYRRYRGDALSLRAAKRSDGAWLNTGFSVECCLKAAIMQKERLRRWPDRNAAPDLWTHNLYGLFRRLGIDPQVFDPKSPVAPALKMLLDWRREHGYSTGKVPIKFADDACEAAFGPDGVIQWIADRYQLNI